MKIADRIRTHYTQGMDYHTLMQRVFPEDAFPRAWRYSHNGGPPGCAMAFGKALRSVGLMRSDNRVVGTLTARPGA